MNNINFLLDDPTIRSFLPQIEGLYTRMDKAYSDISQAHGFHCQGCQDNCCETWFFHHTFGEYIAIMKGCNLLEPNVFDEALDRAKKVIKQVNTFHDNPDAFRTMCPLNQDGKCLIYEHRPMICRLHGVHYQFTMPNKVVHQGPGCQAFEDMAKISGVEAVLDRSPFYMEMSALEKDLRQAVGFTKKIKMTVAEMLARQNGKP